MSRNVDIDSCPACDGDAFFETGCEAQGFTVMVSAREFRQEAYRVRECCSCGLLFRTPIPRDDELAEYYQLVDFRKLEIRDFYPTERHVLTSLRAWPQGARLFDFGCSGGRLLAPLVSDYNCWGFEINRAAAAAAAAKGLKMITGGSVEELPRHAFDAVIMVDVFEHLLKPLVLLEKLFCLVKAGGALLVVTGNGDTRACRLDPAQFWYFRTFEHLCMLTRRNAQFVASKLAARLEVWHELEHYDTPWPNRLLQAGRHFAYWQFQRRTLLAATLLPVTPFLRRARHWPVAPAFTCSRDHILAIFRKPLESNV